jgi:hypothetical protein
MRVSPGNTNALSSHACLVYVSPAEAGTVTSQCTLSGAGFPPRIQSFTRPSCTEDLMNPRTNFVPSRHSSISLFHSCVRGTGATPHPSGGDECGCTPCHKYNYTSHPAAVACAAVQGSPLARGACPSAPKYVATTVQQHLRAVSARKAATPARARPHNDNSAARKYSLQPPVLDLPSSSQLTRPWASRGQRAGGARPR